MIEKRCQRKKRKNKLIWGMLIALLAVQAIFPVAAFAGTRMASFTQETVQEAPASEEGPALPTASPDASASKAEPSPAPQEMPLSQESAPKPTVTPEPADEEAPAPTVMMEAPAPPQSTPPQLFAQEAAAFGAAPAAGAPATQAAQPCEFLDKIDVTYIEPQNPPYPRNATVRLEYGYLIPAGITINTEYTFNVPDVFKFTQDFVIDLKTDGTKVGEARISSADNAVALIFFDSAAVIAGCTGEIWVTVQFDPGKIDNAGLQPVVFKDGGNNMIGTVEVPFLIDQIEGSVPVTEEGAVDLANMKIDWTATLSPTLKNVASADKDKPEGKIDPLVFTTVIEEGQSFDISMLTDCSAMIQGGGKVLDARFSYDATSKTLTCAFADPVESGDKIIVSYPTKFTVASFGGANSKIFHNAAQVAYQIPQYDVSGRTAVLSTPKADQKNAEKNVNAEMVMLDKKQSLSGREITWTVDINKSGLTVSNAEITDTLPAGLRIIGTPVLEYADGSVSPTASIDVDTPADPLFTLDSLSKITVKFGADLLQKHCTLTYTTKIHDDFYQQNKVEPFRNNVSFTGNVGGEGIDYHKNATATVTTSLITKSGTYSTQDHTISWTIGFNSNLTSMLGTELTDVIPQGLTLDASSVQIGGADPPAGATTYETASRTLHVTLGELNGTEQQVTYRTTVDDNAIWANNYGPQKPFDNVAKLEATVDGKAVSIEASYQPEIVSKVISCEAVQNDYNYADKLAKWRLTVNQNQMEITNGAVEVEIPQGQAFEAFCAALPADYSYTVTKPATGPSRLKITLPSSIVKGSAPIELEYWTKITDLEAFNENPKVNIDNTATLVSGETPAGGVRAEADQAVANSVVKKSGEVKSGVTNVVTWKVLVNENLIPMKSPTLRDPLMEGLVLDPGSVTLYRLGIANGKANENQRTPVSLWDGAIEYDTATGLFLFHFEGDINDAYLLVFDTHIDYDKTGGGNKSFINSVSLSGGDVQQQGTPAQLNTFVFNDGGVANKFSGAIKIRKQDENGAPLKGAQFKLNNVLKTTDANGEALFDQLMPGTYTGKEVSAPENCIAAPADTPDALKNITVAVGVNAPVEVRVENTRIKSALEITKTDELGRPVPGVVFRVRSTGQTPPYDKTITTDENGKVLFDGLLYGSYTYEVVSAPEQYVVDKSPVLFSVARDDHDKTIEQTVISALKKEPAPSEPPQTPSDEPAGEPSDTPAGEPTIPPGETNGARTPRTGDLRDTGIFLLLTGLGAAGMTVGMILRGKRKKA